MEENTVNEGKTTAIISYITFIGTIVAYFMNKDKKNPFVSFHIRQMIGLSLLSIISNVVSSVTGIAMIGSIVGLGLLVLWVVGFMGMLKGEEKKVPFLGDLFQDWFKGI